MSITIIWVIVAAIVALIAGYFFALSRSKSNASSEAKIILEEARNQASVIKEKKLLEAREQEMQIKNEAEKQASQRLQKVQTAEARLKQCEMDLNRQQSDFGKRRKEVEDLSSRL